MTGAAAPFEAVGNRRRLDRLPGGGFAYVFLDEALRIEARYLRRERGSLHAEVDVQCSWAGVARHGPSLSCAEFNLSSQTARRALAKHCAERARTDPEAFDWLGALDSACLEIIRADRHAETAGVLDDAPEAEQRDHHVAGLTLPADAVSLIVAHGGSLKSLIALFVAGTLAQRGLRVLYLDWEWSADRHKARKLRLFGPDRLDGLRYLRCLAPLTVEADRLRRYCDGEGIDYLIVDSVGLAADGKLTDDDTAVRFHRALAGLPAALAAAHVPKSTLGPDGKEAVGPFGSVFFANLARAVWQIKKTTDGSPEADTVAVGLFPQKQNDGARVVPVGLRFHFTEARITVQAVDLADVDGLAERLPLAVRMRHYLARHGPASYQDLAGALGAKLNTIIQTATRNPAFEKLSQSSGAHLVTLACHKARAESA